MSEKIIGYLLIVVGIMVIIYSALSVYGVFTKQIRPVELFAFSGISMDPTALMGNIQLPEGVTLPPSAGTKMEVVPPDIINDTSNIFAHVVLMGFIAGIGYKLASLGVQLVRPIVVKLKNKEQDTVVSDK